MGNLVEGHGLIKFIETKVFHSFPSKKTGKKIWQHVEPI
jgi:hypothetical protein